MPRVYKTYDLPQGGGTHAQATTGAGNTVQTISPPQGDASACFVSVRTNNAYITVDGSTPSAANGLEIIAGAQPLFVPLGREIKAIGAAANTIVNVLWLD